MRKHEEYYNQYLKTNPQPVQSYNKWLIENSIKPETKFVVEVKMGENIICKRKWHYSNENNDFTPFYPEIVKSITDAVNVIEPQHKKVFNDEITIVITNDEKVDTFSFVSNRTKYKIDVKDKINQVNKLLGLKAKSIFVPPVYEIPIPKKITLIQRISNWLPFSAKFHSRT